MKIKLASLVLLIVAMTAFGFSRFYQKEADPWTEKQLMSPADLAKIIKDPDAKKPLIFSIGFESGIKGSVVMGAARDRVNLDKFTTALTKLPKDANIVIYCGCCPFVHCPNIRPAVKLLNQMEFSNFKLLNLEHNLKADWIDKGYPMNN
jgi:thiosulfate/3-mercaptopyruvate sulfurtransferase